MFVEYCLAVSPWSFVRVSRKGTRHIKIWFLCLRNLTIFDESNNIFPTASGDPESVAGEYGRHSLYKMLGYFSLVGLLRLHSLLGDYYQAIKVLENIELNKKVIFYLKTVMRSRNPTSVLCSL